MDKSKKIRVLWLSSLPPFRLFPNSTNFSGGWLSGAYESIKQIPDIELVMMFPVSKSLGDVRGEAEKSKYIGFSLPRILKLFKIKFLQKKVYKKIFQEILQSVKPDILHVFGTEDLYTRMAIQTFNKPERTIIHIQGLVSVYAQHCLFGFPWRIRHRIVFDSLLNGTIQGKARRLRRSGIDEIESIKRTNIIMGRTEWDEACSKAINPESQYILCGESLRTAFYDNNEEWSSSKCIPHTVYFSQCNSQVKGMHLVLPQLPQLIKTYPDFHMYVGGDSPLSDGGVGDFFKKSSLELYLTKLVEKYRLQNHVTFLGPQNAEQVVRNLQKANVFLSSSLIENSPNSVGEALMIGTPIVSSDVGGVKDFITHGHNGFIYPMDEPYMIPYYISKIFEDSALATQFSNQGRLVANSKYNHKTNGLIVQETYQTINRG